MTNPCGKDCETCAVRASISCKGCSKVVYEEGCELADCVSRNKHESCTTCTMRPTCPTRREANTMYKKRQEQREAQQRQMEQVTENASVLAVPMRLMFWINIGMVILGLLDDLFEKLPVLSAVVYGFTIVCYLTEIFCLMKMGRVDTRYRTASVFLLFNVLRAVCGALILFFAPGATAFQLLVAVVGGVLDGFTIYYTYTAHSWVTTDVDSDLSEQWESLWKWKIGISVGAVFSPLLAIFGGLGMLAMLAILILMIVIDVRCLIALYRTAELFRYYVE